MFSDEEVRVVLPFYQKAFPKKLIAARMISIMDGDDAEQTYIPLIKASADINFLDDDFTVGSCHCSNCGKTIDIFDKFCSECGAKITGRRDLGAQ